MGILGRCKNNLSVTFRLSGSWKTLPQIVGNWKYILHKRRPLSSLKTFTFHAFVCAYACCCVTLLITFLNDYLFITNILGLNSKQRRTLVLVQVLKCLILSYDNFNTCLNDSRNQFAFLSLILLVRLRKKDKRTYHMCVQIYIESYMYSPCFKEILLVVWRLVLLNRAGLFVASLTRFSVSLLTNN